jgi:probable rRNA maturation factor
MNAKNPIVNVILLEKRWAKLTHSWKKEILCAIDKTTQIVGEKFPVCEVSVVLADDKAVQNLNKTFRHKNYPTNVLSFPSEEEGELGDIILGYETVMREASESGISPLHHALHLIIHGFLHLLGYDHEKETEAHQMESLEIRILKDLNIQNPYEDL